jgi:glycosyltransferase involved in cell wall biosynthesis
VSYAKYCHTKALGDYILTLDADDYFDPSLWTLIKFTEDASYGAIMCGYVHVKEKK